MFARFSLGALNHLLRQADWARARLTPFAGSHARLSMPPWQLDWEVRPDGYCEATAGATPDVTMTLPSDAPLRALQGVEQVMAVARVEGNAQFATELSFVLRNLRWDAEEDLSRVVGDIAAHRMVQTAGKVASWQKDAAQRLAENLAEYLGEENPLVVRTQDMTDFVAEVSALRQDLSRLEQRVAKLSR